MPFDDALKAGVQKALAQDQNQTVETAAGPVFIEVFNPRLRCIIVGAVHIAQPLARMAALARLSRHHRRSAHRLRHRRALPRHRALDRLAGRGAGEAQARQAHRHRHPDPRSQARRSGARRGAAHRTPSISARSARKHPCAAAAAAGRARLQRRRARAHPRPGRARHRRGLAGRDRGLDPGPDDARCCAPTGAAARRKRHEIRRDAARRGGGRHPRAQPQARRPHPQERPRAQRRRYRRRSPPPAATSVIAARLEPGDVAENEAAEARRRGRSPDPMSACGRAFTGRANFYADVAGLLPRRSRGGRALQPGRRDRSPSRPCRRRAWSSPSRWSRRSRSSPSPSGRRRSRPAPALAGDTDLQSRAVPRHPRRADPDPPARPQGEHPRQDRRGDARPPGRARQHASSASAAATTTRRRSSPELSEALAGGAEMVLIAGASAILDRRDVIPAAIVACGGAIEHFGMPVDPGNLLLMGRVGAVPVLGLPGCARSPKVNGFDWVLRRLLAGLPVDAAVIARMGVGGLLSEIPTRPQPRAGTAEDGRGADRAAAAAHRRAGARRRPVEPHGHDQQAADRHRRQADGAPRGRSRARSRAQAGRRRHRPPARPSSRRRWPTAGVTFVHNPDYAEGLSTSLKAGIAALPDDVDGVLVGLGDMPRVGSGDIERLVAAFNPVEGRVDRRPDPQRQARQSGALGQALLAGDAAGRGRCRRPPPDRAPIPRRWSRSRWRATACSPTSTRRRRWRASPIRRASRFRSDLRNNFLTGPL